MKLKLFSTYTLPPYVAGVFRAIALIATLVLVHESLLPAGQSPSLNNFDKFMHFASYCLLTGLWALAFNGRGLLKITIILTALGFGLEVAQHVMELGRTGSIWDALANFAGCGVAALVATRIIEADAVSPENSAPQMTG